MPGVKISMDGRGTSGVIIFSPKRLWRTIKYEEVYLHEYASPKEAYRQLFQYINFITLSARINPSSTAPLRKSMTVQSLWYTRLT